MQWVTKRKIIISTGTVLILCVLGALLLWPRTPNPIPATIRTTSPIGLFYPTKLPESYVVDTTSFSVTEDVVSYRVKTPEGKSLLFTQQRTPDAFDFKNFYDVQIKNARKANTKYGDVILGSFEGNSIGSLRTAETWLLISAPGDVSPSTIEQMVSNLTQSRPDSRDN